MSNTNIEGLAIARKDPSPSYSLWVLPNKTGCVFFDIKRYDVRKAVELVLHGSEIYDPNDKRNKGRKPNFEVVMGKSRASRIHDGTAVLRVPTEIYYRFLRWKRRSDKNDIVVHGRALLVSGTPRKAPPGVEQVLNKALYTGPEKDKLREQIRDLARQVCSRVAQIQVGVWYKQENPPPNQGRTFSVEYERVFPRHSAANISIMYDHKLIRIEIRQETERTKYFILVKFAIIRKLGLGFDEFGQPFIIFDLHMPPNFEQESRAPGIIERNRRYKTRSRISALDDAHARVALYAYHLRVLLTDADDLIKFEMICHVTQCEPRPIRVERVDAHPMQFFSQRDLYRVQRWIKTMDWNNAFQIEAYLRCGLLNTHDLLFTLQTLIDEVIRDYGAQASELLRLFSVALRMRKDDESPSDCLARVRSDYPTIKPLRLAQGYISCHHVIITPSRMLLEGPYPMQSNRVIRHYQNHDTTFVERFICVEFRDEDHLAYRWDTDVDGTWFLQQRVGGILREGFELGGRGFEFLGYSMSALREHSVWFVSPFRDPVEGYVTAEKICASLGDFSGFLRTPSKYAARIAQAFAMTDSSLKIRRDQWEEQVELGPHTDGVGTISPDLADIIWAAKCRMTRSFRENRVKPSAYQFRFLGYKGVVVVDHRLKGIKMRLRDSQRKFPVHNVEEAEFEIARSFDCPNQVYLNRPAVMVLDNCGVKTQTFLDLQENAKASIYHSRHSLERFRELLASYNLGSRFQLTFIIKRLAKLGLDFDNDKKTIRSAFFERLIRYSTNHSLRDIKFKARIPVPNSYQLVGVADEGRAYINEGAKEDDVFTLKEGFVYVCVQEYEHEPPKYLKGTCLISRSPVIHPGDMLRVYAVGEPPEDKLCFFGGLKNVVVFPAVGDRSLASCLAGGDLDGVDICDFVIEYINSDVMGLLADRHTVIADQSKEGVFDERCMKLAALCSKAVDYAKNGQPVDIYNNLPKRLLKSRAGIPIPNIHLHDPNEPIEGFPIALPGEVPPLADAISCVLIPLVQSTLNAATEPREVENEQPKELHAHYVREMQYICMTHTLVDAPDVRLTEEEVVLGTILASYCPGDEPPTADRLRAGLSNAWAAWGWAQRHRDKEFIESFSLVVLGVVLDCLERLGGLPEA
ncbi:RNA dependent RNA polymerase-domain-containing protein [Lactifluus subvellereus]|nr:RNA dependent RNA polymerase-domain-containing protein [Lactifluus subvellereus]